MPQRTNDFQTLILLIETQLADAGTIVTESKMVRDETIGEDREVDVHMVTRTEGATTTIGIECVAQRRPADVTWVEARILKHRDLATAKLVLVSKSGFTEAALVKASHHGALAMTLEAATMASWRNLPGRGSGIAINELRMSHLRIAVPQESRLQLSLAKGALPPQGGGLSSSICDPSGLLVGTPVSIVEGVLSSDRTLASFQCLAPNHGDELPLSFDLQFPEGWTLRGDDGVSQPIFGCLWHGVGQLVKMAVPMAPSLYGDTRVISGTTTLGNLPLVTAAVQSHSAKFSVAMSLGPGQPPLVFEWECT